MRAPPSSDERLARLLGGPVLAGVRRRLRRYFAQQGASYREMSQGAAVRIANLSPEEYEGLALLTGKTARPARSVLVDIRELDLRLREAGLAESLFEALERLDGPIVNHSALKNEDDRAWSDLIVGVNPRHQGLRQWLRGAAATPLLKRISRRDRGRVAGLLTQADAVLAHLPSRGLVRARLAAVALGNAHGLDDGQPVAAIVLAVLRDAADSLAEAQSPAQDERSRDAWARAGVLVNELARPVLLLNVPYVDSDAGEDERPGLNISGLGEPDYLSLRQLLRAPRHWTVQGKPVYVCENPNLVAIAADTLGAACAPLVCTDGMPAAAQRTLLEQLARAGALLRYHGDFDWPGIQIANNVFALVPVQPWRMSASDYDAAVRDAPHLDRDIFDPAVDAHWDGQLAARMLHHGLSIAEEAVAHVLLEDLQMR